MDIDIDITTCIRNQHTQDIAINLTQQWKKQCLSGSRKNENHIHTKRKVVQRKIKI